MINETVWRRMLYLSIGLIFVVAVILAFVVIPPPTIPETAIIPASVIATFHLLIIVALIWTINVDKRGGRINKELLVAAGVIPIVFSLMSLDGAFAYINTPNLHSVGISLLICSGCDFVAGLLALIARYFRRYGPLSK